MFNQLVSRPLDVSAMLYHENTRCSRMRYRYGDGSWTRYPNDCDDPSHPPPCILCAVANKDTFTVCYNNAV